MTYEKKFQKWSELKTIINDKKGTRTFNEREIWWASLGVNVGYELDGKNQSFDRPILIIKKTSHHTFIGLPLTSQLRKHPTRIEFNFNQRPQVAILEQIRLFDAKRLNNIMGQLSDEEFNRIRKSVGAFLGV